MRSSVIVCGDPPRFAAALESMPDIRVTLSAEDVEVTGDVDGSDVIRHLAQHELFPSEVRWRSRTLDQIFFETLTDGDG